MSKISINAEHAPAAVGPYSHAAKPVGNTVFLSGQVGLIPGTKNLAEGLEPQVRQAFANMLTVVAAAGGTPVDIVKLTLFVTDMADFPVVNTVMAEVIPQPYPARSTVGVASLPLGARFEVEAIIAV